MILAVSEITREVDRAFWLIGGTCILLFLGVTGAMLFFAFKYRRSQQATTKQIHGHTMLEVTWIIIPTLIVTWMFFVGLRGFELMRGVPDDGMLIKVTGKQWSWSFNYPEEDVEDNILVVPVDTNIRCEMQSPPDDVIHSFYLPAFRVKEDVLPGRTTHMWFRPERIGSYQIFCAEFCGKDHSEMLTELKVVSQEDFDAWVKNKRAKKYEPLIFEAIVDPKHPKFGEGEQNINAESKYAVFCASCHGNDGRGEGVEGARNFTVVDGWKNGPKVTDIYRTLEKGIEGTQMRAFPVLTPWDRVALAHYVRTFLGKQAPTDTQEDFEALVKEYGLDKLQPPGEGIPIEEAMQQLVDEAKTQRKQ